MTYTSNNALLRKMVKNFMGVLIMKYLKKQQLANAYEIIRYVHKEFGVLVSPGTVYSAVYSLERQSFIKGKSEEGKSKTSRRVYRLTKKGEEMIDNAFKAKHQIQLLVSKIFSQTQGEAK